jgi:hypothetical protein
MTISIRYALGAVAAILLAWFAYAGDETPASQGKIALLANGRLLEGEIERVGDQYRVRRTTGETWLSAEQVRHLCGSLEEALAYLRGQTNLQDPDERLRLARWCMVYGLRSQALAEASAAVELRPNHAESVRLVRALQRSLATADSTPAPAAPGPPASESSPPPQPYNPASLGLFVSKVQPILMNTCASCHATGKGGNFKLQRIYGEGGSGNQRTTQYNLMAALAQLDRAAPAQSALLSKATLIHYANADQPPIRDRKSPAYRALEEWVHLALTGLPKPAVGPATPQAVLVKPSPENVAKPQVPLEVTAKPPAEPEPAASHFAQPAPAEETPAPATEPADEFDPMIFNRQMHRGK